jgi:multidrug resistance efflux pump
MLRRLVAFGAVGIVVTSAVAGAIGYARIPAPVELERSEAIIADIIRRVSVNGVVVPSDRINVYALMSLRALDVRVVAGQSVRRGDVLARLDSSAVDLELAKRETVVARAEAALFKLDSGGSVSEALHENAPDKSARALDVRLKTLELREARLELARVRRIAEATVLVAPIDGEVVAVSVRSGEIALAHGQGPPPFVLAKTDAPTIDAEADEFQAASIRVGQRAFVHVESAFPGRPILGQVSSAPQLRRAPSVINGPAAFGLTVKLVDTPDGLRNGVSARIEIETGIARAAVAVPVAAVFEFDAADHVIEALPGGAYAVTPVRAGLSDTRFVAIESHLKRGSSVLVGDPSRLRELARQLSVARSGSIR